jgi:hypothetical protein
MPRRSSDQHMYQFELSPLAKSGVFIMNYGHPAKVLV